MLEALLSIPIISSLALPFFSSYSTSLNLLFFYMTWSTLVLSHSELNVELYGTLFVRVLFYILPSLLFLAFDTSVPSLACEIKAEGDVALPGRKGRRKVMEVVGWALANVLLGVGVQAGTEMLFTRVLQIRSALKVTTRLPMPWGMFKDIVRGLLLRNVLTYYIHRYLLHAPTSRTRTRLVRWHATWQHSLQAPYSFVAAYDHPACWFLARFLPLYAPAVAFRMHILSYLLLLAVTSLEDALVWSGYSILPSTIILPGMARRLDAHMVSGGKGNFAPWGVLDWVHGTSLGQDVMDDLRDEMDKHDVQERTGNAVNRAGDVMGDVGTRLRSKGRRKSGRK